MVIPNERLKMVSEQRITLANAFEVADDVLRQGVQSISQLIKIPGLVNLDFADVTAVMKDAGYAHMGLGRAGGKEKQRRPHRLRSPARCLKPPSTAPAASSSISPPPPDIDLEDVEIASSMISRAAHPDATIIWGAAFDESMDDELCVTVIATGFVTDGSYKAQDGTVVAPGQVTSPNVAEDDDYTDILGLFRKRHE